MIINSLLENDFYNFTMMQAILHHFPSTQVTAKFKCRNADISLMPYFDRIKEEINHLGTLMLTEDELSYMSKIPFLKKDFIDYLENFRLHPEKNVKYVITKDFYGKEKLDILFMGSWLQIILFETPVLAIINQIYFEDKTNQRSTYYSTPFTLDAARHRLEKKIDYIRENASSIFQFADFGMRRRFSSEWHDEVVETLKRELPTNFIGTSNVFLAKKHNIKYIGTMAHQWICAGQGIPGIRLSDSQKHMLEVWAKEYRGDLGIALSDTLGMDAFLRDFDKYFAKLYDGARHDSGDPFIWCEKLIDHYKKLGIDPRTKTAVFTDGLDIQKAIDIVKKFHNKIQTSFGIGTNLTNDVGFTPLNIIIKLIKVNRNPVAKLSDSPGKGMCEDYEYLNYLKKVFASNMTKD
jgi:nicotinate phosphoribosyltransferase